jgi:hypothetical protein
MALARHSSPFGASANGPAEFRYLSARGTAARCRVEVVTTSMLDFLKADNEARRFGLMRGQLRKVHVAPIGKAHNLSTTKQMAFPADKPYTHETTSIRFRLLICVVIVEYGRRHR